VKGGVTVFVFLLVRLGINSGGGWGHYAALWPCPDRNRPAETRVLAERVCQAVLRWYERFRPAGGAPFKTYRAYKKVRLGGEVATRAFLQSLKTSWDDPSRFRVAPPPSPLEVIYEQW
jgi:hypothetical protein